MPAFSGFSERATSFYAALEVDNTKEFWTAHKRVYETEVRDPMKALLSEVEPEFGPGRMFRPYRDARRLRLGDPLYKTQQAALVGGMESGFYLSLDADGLVIGGGFRAHTPAQVTAYRAAVADDRTGPEFVARMTDLLAAGFSLAEDRLERLPRDYPEDHPRAGLLRYRSIMASKREGTPEWLRTPAALDHVRAAWRDVRPVVAWCITNVAAKSAG